MQDIEGALVETEPFAWSRDHDALDVIPDDDGQPGTLTIVAGVPNGEWEALLDEWTAAALEAVPAATIEDAVIGETDTWKEGPSVAVTIRLSLQ